MVGLPLSSSEDLMILAGFVLGPVAPTTIKLEPSSNSTLTLVQSHFSLHQHSSALNTH